MKRLIARELMDDDETIGTPGQWRQTLHDLERINRFLGGWHALRSVLARLDPLPCSIVDVATGGADLAARCVEFLKQRNIDASCVAVDRSRRIVELAREFRAGRAGIEVLAADARHLPFPDRTFDLATMNLTLHHFDPAEAIGVLRELARVARNVIVNDLRRSLVAWAFARCVLPLFTTNQFTRHDGPVSVLRAYTPLELQTMAQLAGWRSYTVRTHPGYRMTLSGGYAA